MLYYYSVLKDVYANISKPTLKYDGWCLYTHNSCAFLTYLPP